MATTVSFTPSRCIMGAGKFDTDFRYIRAGATGATFPLPKTNTVRIASDASFGRNVMWRWTTSVHSMEFMVSGGATGLGDATATVVKI